MRFSIRSIMLFGFCGLLGGSIAIVILVGLFGTIGNSLTLIARDAVHTVDEAERRLIGELAPIEHQARFIAQQIESGRLRFDDRDRVVLMMEAAMGTLPDLAGMLLVDPNGVGYRFLGDRRTGAFPEVTVANFADIRGLSKVIERARDTTDSVWLRPVWLPELRQALINLHTPLYRDGQFVGLLIQGKAVADLSIRLRALADGDERVPFLLYDGGWVLAHPGLAELALDGSEDAPLPGVKTFQDAVLQGFTELDEAMSQNFVDDARTRLGNYDFGDEVYFFASRELTGIAADRPVTVGVYQNIETYESITVRTVGMIAVGVAVLILSVVAALWLARTTARPVTALAEAFRRVRDGDLDKVPTLPPSRLKELNDASRAFEGMVAGLRERERIRALFGRVVPEKVAERMLTSSADLAPQTAEATVLFCDLADFTRMTEELGAERLVSVLNRYFTDMVDIVHAHGGIVTQFQGDAILAVFNLPVADPEHVGNAIAAAKEMRGHLVACDYDGRRLRNRIGIATGSLIAANVGAQSRMNYTVHGDTVNLAARLESMNKELGTTILIDAAAARAASLPLSPKGSIAVRGQSAPVEVYTLEKDG